MMLENLAESQNLALDEHITTEVWAKKKEKDIQEGIEAVLIEEIDLAKPDDLPYLESQVPRIAGRIIYRLCSRDDSSK